MHPNPTAFGPHFWFVLHSVSFFYPENPTDTDMKIHKDYFESFVHVLPCEDCKMHYRVLLTKYPIDGHLESRDELSRWVVFIHNQVNKRLGKPEMAYDQVVSNYRNVYAYSPGKFSVTRKTRNVTLGVLSLILLFVCYERFYMKNKLF